MNKWGQIHADNGPFVSSKNWSYQDRQDTEVHFHHREKSDVMMTACTSWYGGDFWEFGSGDLNTFRDFLTAFDICGMCRAYEDTRFYACDIFGKLEKDMGGELNAYFEPYSKRGDTLAHHENLIQVHGLNIDRIYLIQGLFENTLTHELKTKWRHSLHPTIDDSCRAKMLHLPPEYRNPKTREIGFASIDCNLWPFYKTVLEFIFDMLAPNSYVYLDEGLQSAEVMEGWKLFCEKLHEKRNLGCMYIRNAGGFGALYRIYPLVKVELNI